MEQQLKELHELKSYLGMKLSRHLAAGGRSDDPFVRSIWDLHGELAAAIEDVERQLEEELIESLEADLEVGDEIPEPEEDLTNIGYLRWLLENEQA